KNRKKQFEKHLKLVNEVSNSILKKRARNIGKALSNNFTDISQQYYNHMDKPILEEFKFSINHHKEYKDENLIAKKQKSEAIVKVIDQKQIV
ncbi:4711_t:CDS:1, partial [Racocetra fulgida]